MRVRQTVFSTPRLTLTTWAEGDLADFHALHADPRTMRFFLSGPYDAAKAARRLADFRREQAAWGWTKWRVEDAPGRTVGRGGFGLSEDGQHRELGYLLAFAHADNGASRRVLEKVGFTLTGEEDWRGMPHAFYRLAAP
ncbi:GNAT family N-acetyltransferase [Deinococcus murrayi]|uniref:GNAT family N-acetyltransferase n=1 Tax=Deinococcus murrayi TaxID=68910 RepID=UPI000B30FDDD|nr:GNAT family N-acetyltransferase [Deinococcus murrayi]